MTTTAPLEETTVQAFSEQLHGEVLQPGEPGYDEARTVWNAMIDKKPAVIARCTGSADVIAAVEFARDLDLRLAVHGGGHNVAGKAVCDGGLMIDLSPMNRVRVDPDAQVARVGGGATWGDFDHEAQSFGLATTGGIVSTTGVAGVTLGGGLGYLARTYGLAQDNLRSIDVVTAEGELVTASEDENSELFWGMRGGLGNFGIATSLEFDLHEVGPEVLAGRIIHPYEAAPQFLRLYRDFMRDAPDELQAYAAFVQGNPAMGMPEPLHGKTLVGVVLLYSGDIGEGREVVQPLREFGEPIADMVEPTPYVEHQQSSDELYQEGHRNYWKSHFFDELTDEAIDTIVEHADPLPSPFTTVFFEWMGGEIARMDPDATAFPHRDATASFTVAPKWTDPEDDEEMIEWARTFFDATAPYATDDVYVNYLSWDEQERAEAAYGDHYERLLELKRTYDPDNLFQVNQNIDPDA
ncbi:MAG: FAD/FMN-containing dehydrogenase [Natronomonas sp.]|jgi:FAD/FMN-containing dehydrogenase